MAGGNSSAAAAGGSGGHSTARDYDADLENQALSNYLLITCAAISIALIVWRVATITTKYVRTVTCLHNDTQRYFALPSRNWSFVKRNLLYAPIFRKRHNREFQLSSAINVGTLPTRFQFLFLVGYFTTNVVFCVLHVPFAGSFTAAAASLRNRTGTLAVVNMIPLFLMAGRNNPLIKLLGISFDTFNLLHRWFGRIVMLESVAHTAAFLASQAYTKGSLAAGFQTTFRVQYMVYGFIATCAFIALSIQASSPLRHAFYETFKLMHIALAILAVVGLWYHMDLKHMYQLKYLVPVIPIWAGERAIRLLSIAYRNLGRGGTRTVVEALPGNACRVTVDMARPWKFQPGQHAYLYVPSIGWWQSHPFSAAWSDDAVDLGADKLAMNRQDLLSMSKTSVSFIVRARTGFTNKLYQKAAALPDGKLVTRCFVEGPYGGSHLLHSYGTVMLFAGGVGITHQVPHVRDLVVGYANGTVATRRIVLVWVIQSPEHLEWIRPWMTHILAMDRRREVLRIMLFVSRPRSTKEIHSPSATVQMFPGRPNVETLLGIEMDSQVGAMAVTACGPGDFSDEVRMAVRNRQYGGTVDFIEEAFSW